MPDDPIEPTHALWENLNLHLSKERDPVMYNLCYALDGVFHELDRIYGLVARLSEQLADLRECGGFPGSQNSPPG